MEHATTRVGWVAKNGHKTLFSLALAHLDGPFHYEDRALSCGPLPVEHVLCVTPDGQVVDHYLARRRAGLRRRPLCDRMAPRLDCGAQQLRRLGRPVPERTAVSQPGHVPGATGCCAARADPKTAGRCVGDADESNLSAAVAGLPLPHAMSYGLLPLAMPRSTSP